MTDGTVIIQDYCTPKWYRLTPDLNDSYLNGSWSELPQMPADYGLLDFASAVLPDGRFVLKVPGATARPCRSTPPNAPNDSSYNFILLTLPTGAVLETDRSSDIEIYQPGVNPHTSVAPVLTGGVPSKLVAGDTYSITGKHCNGFSQANMYGDDDQEATNFPLVRIVNKKTRHVFYARTHDFSFMGVASEKPVSTSFDVPSSIETGPSNLFVVANGIASKPAATTISAP